MIVVVMITVIMSSNTVTVYILHVFFQVRQILTGRLQVHFIDYGNNEVVNVNKVIIASPELFTIPPLAELFLVAGLTPRNGVSWTNSEQQVIHENLLNAEFNAVCVANGAVGFPSAIQLLDASFLPQLLPVSTVCSPVIELTDGFEIGRVYTVYFTHCESMLDFYIQDSCIQETLDRFHEAIFKSVQGGKAARLSESACRPGTVCVARYRGSDQFYRAVLKEVSWHSACHVTYVDYGDSASVELTDLWPLAAEFCQLPLQAVHCSVTGSSCTINPSEFRRLYATGQTVPVCIRGKTKLQYLIEIATGSKVSPGSIQAAQMPKYVSSQLNCTGWHDVCISHVEDDGSFYVQLLANAQHLNEMMMALSRRSYTPVQAIRSSIVNGMATVVRDPTDNCLYRSEVCITKGH